VRVATLTQPRGLKAPGARLWQTLVEGRELTAGNAVLAEEACRIKDRLDVLDKLVSGDAESWFTLRRKHGDGDETLVVVVNGALSEARQQANVLRQIVAGLPVKGDNDDTGAPDFIAGL
jgi:hypothetical protein